jgi:hypothetical protein
MIATNADRSNGGTFRNVQHDTHDLSLLLLSILELCIPRYYAISTAQALHACFTFGSVHPNA